MVTEERDKLRNVVNEFKKPKNDGGGDERANLTLTKVLENLSFFYLLHFFCN